MPHDSVPEMLDNALKELEAEFSSLPGFEAETGAGQDAMAAVLAETAHRLGDNYPYFHPLYAGQMLKPPHPVARAAYALAMKLNPNNHALDGGRASSAMEVEAVREIAGMFGWTEGQGSYLGHLTSSGTFANLEALWMAGQLAPGKRIVGSEQAHYTHGRISKVLQLKFESVKADSRGRMDLEALEGGLRKGDVGAVVATLGTTAIGAVDRLDEILGLKKKYGFRVHVDAAYGGYFGLIADALDEPARRAYAAIGEADSIVIDPHKHGLQPYGCGCVLFRDAAVGRFYKHDSPYTYFTSKEMHLHPSEPKSLAGDPVHLGEISLECSRAGAAAVALWATQRLLPLKPGGEFARGLERGRRAALELDRRLREDERFATLGESLPMSQKRDPSTGSGQAMGHPALGTSIPRSPNARDRGQPPELDIVVWALHAADFRKASVAAQGIFDACARNGLHLALVQLPGSWFRSDWSDEHVTCLRSVLMKPEHEAWIDRIWAILSEARGKI